MKKSNLAKYLGIYQMILGVVGIIFAQQLLQFLKLDFPHNPFIVISVLYFVLGFGVFLASYSLIDNWLIVFINLMKKVLIILVSLYFGVTQGVNIEYASFVILDSILSIFFLYQILDYIFVNKYDDDDASYPPSLESLKLARTNTGENLVELSHKNPLLLVFIRHFGCTFCRETVSEVSKIEDKIKQKGLTPVFVHLSDPSFGDEFFEKYFSHRVLHVSDPARRIYRALKIRRGNLWQLYGLPTWYRGFIAGFFKGHGGVSELEGDEMQLGAYFVLDKGNIVFSHHNDNASEEFNFENVKLS